MKTFIAPAPTRVPHRGRLYVARDVLPASRRPSLSRAQRAWESGLAFQLQRLADRFCKRNHFCGAPCWPNRRPVSIEMVMARSLTPTAVQGQDAGTVQSPNALPDRLRDVEHLEEVMTTPAAALIAALQELPGDIIILGVGGKIGPTLARLAKRAAPGKRVVGVARFSEKGVREKLAGWAIECVEADLLERKQIDALPKLPNVVFMAGRKFGSSGHEDLTWAMNAHVPALIAEAFAGSRIVAYSTGCVYPYVNVHHGGATETTPTTPPPGVYANSCVAREAMFQYFSRTRGTPGRIIRLNYAIDMRYGVLHDVAARVLAGTPINLTTGHVNVIWQCHGAARARSLHRAFEPAQRQRAGDGEHPLPGASLRAASGQTAGLHRRRSRRGLARQYRRGHAPVRLSERSARQARRLDRRLGRARHAESRQGHALRYPPWRLLSGGLPSNSR